MSVAATVRPAGGVLGDIWTALTGGPGAAEFVPDAPAYEPIPLLPYYFEDATPAPITTAGYEDDPSAFGLLFNCFPDSAGSWDTKTKIQWAERRWNDSTWYWSSWGEKECGIWLGIYGGSGGATGIEEGYSGTAQERRDVEAAFHLAATTEVEAGGEFSADATAALDALAQSQRDRRSDPWHKFYEGGESIGQTVRRVADGIADTVGAWWPYLKWGGLAALGVFLVYLARPFFVTGAKLVPSR